MVVVVVPALEANMDHEKGSGPHAGEIIMDLEGEDPGIIVHRASLLRELVAPLPQSSLHTNKKLVTINVRPDTDDEAATSKALEVTFEDGTVEQADAVIGADGIFGLVRSHVLQGEAETHSASPAGFWDSRVLVPMEKAHELFGETSFDANRQTAWVGNGAFLMLDAVENGTVLQCVISAVEKSSVEENRKHEVTVDSLKQTLADWDENPIAKGMIEVTRLPPSLNSRILVMMMSMGANGGFYSFAANKVLLTDTPNGNTSRLRHTPRVTSVSLVTLHMLRRHGKARVPPWLLKTL